jgi:hydroxyethylthiazole kinase
VFKEILNNVRQNHPLIHNITNYVTANDCANILLACGGSAIMADDIDEVEEITSICNGLNINIGTLNQRTIPAMIASGKKANQMKIPAVLDVVGAGASELRTNTAFKLINEVHFNVIKGNISEIKSLIFGRGTTNGVDADIYDIITENNLCDIVGEVKKFAKKVNAVIVITGSIDVVADSKSAYCIFNGHPMMRNVTGAGCQLSSLIAAFLAANPENTLQATAAAVSTMGICGETAHKRLVKADGNATYRNYIIDAVYNLDGDSLEQLAKYKIL